MLIERHEGYESFLDMLSALVMTADIITHPDTEEIKNWSWDKESKEKANGQASSIR